MDQRTTKWPSHLQHQLGPNESTGLWVSNIELELDQTAMLTLKTQDGTRVGPVQASPGLTMHIIKCNCLTMHIIKYNYMFGALYPVFCKRW